MSTLRERRSQEVLRVLILHGPGQGKRLSLRGAERHTGISYQTISKMADGEMVDVTTVEKFAVGFGEDVVKWLPWYGYSEEESLSLRLSPKHGIPYPPHDPQTGKIVKLYRRLSEESQNLIESMMEQLAGNR